MTEVVERLRAVLARSQALTVGGGIVLVLLVGCVAVPHRLPFGIVLQGALYGSVTGLLGLGLVLTYRSDRIVNFSYGAMGGVGGSVGVLLYLGKHWNYFVCLLIGLAVGALVGAGTELLVIRRFARASRLILTVATIGLAQVLGGIQLLLPKWLSGPPLVGGFRTPLSGPHLNIGPVLFTGDALLVVVMVPLVIAALAWFLLRTDSGIAIRAVADNRDRAMLLGVPIRRLATVVWIVAGVLATLTTLLSAPTAGLTINAAAGPTLLLPALAAAVIAGMESLPIAFVSGVGLGVLDAVVRWNFSKQSVTTVAFLAVILAGNLITRTNLDLFVCLVAAAAAGALLAIAVGLPALRIRGLFLAVTTLALAVTVDAFFLNPTNFASIIPSTIDRPILWKRFDLNSELSLYYLCLAMLVLAILVVHGFRNTRPGRVMLA